MILVKLAPGLRLPSKPSTPSSPSHNPTLTRRGGVVLTGQDRRRDALSVLATTTTRPTPPSARSAEPGSSCSGPACKAPVSAGARFCKKCGFALGPANPAASATLSASSTRPQIVIAADSAAPSALDGERKTVTALFADIKGSTELMEDLDPEEARAIIDPALKLMIDAAIATTAMSCNPPATASSRCSARRSPTRTIRSARLYAALRMQEELTTLLGGFAPRAESPIEGRVGVNTGEVVVRSIQTGAGQTEYTPIGHTTNLASRMQTLAPSVDRSQ